MNLPDFLQQGEHGDIRLTGHRIDLMHVVDLYNEGQTPLMIAMQLDTLSVYQIEKVIDFYLKNRGEVNVYVHRCRTEIDRQIAEHPPGPGVLRIRRLMQMVEEADAKFGADPCWMSLSIMEKVQRLKANGVEPS